MAAQPLGVDQRASLASGYAGDLGREEIAASPARHFGNPAAEFAALAVLRQSAWSKRAADRNRVSSGSLT
jgi:hypothetical protein